jgi:hypothetical protein
MEILLLQKGFQPIVKEEHPFFVTSRGRLAGKWKSNVTVSLQDPEHTGLLLLTLHLVWNYYSHFTSISKPYYYVGGASGYSQSYFKSGNELLITKPI